jgi:hypothetical protein
MRRLAGLLVLAGCAAAPVTREQRAPPIVDQDVRVRHDASNEVPSAADGAGATGPSETMGPMEMAAWASGQLALPGKPVVETLEADRAPICAGAASLPRVKPHRAACCYPAWELVKRPIRAIHPALRSCYAAGQSRDVGGRVVFEYRIEQDGSVRRVCSSAGTTLDDASVRCMLEETRNLRFHAATDEDVALCGLITLRHPVRFEP